MQTIWQKRDRRRASFSWKVVDLFDYLLLVIICAPFHQSHRECIMNTRPQIIVFPQIIQHFSRYLSSIQCQLIYSSSLYKYHTMNQWRDLLLSHEIIISVVILLQLLLRLNYINSNNNNNSKILYTVSGSAFLVKSLNLKRS